MSPVSRGRKTKKKPAPLDAQLRAGFEEALDAFEDVVASDDPLDVELLTSEILGSFWPGEGAVREVGFPLVGYAASRQTPAAFGLLRALAALSPAAELRDRAEAAAERLATLGMREPRWGQALREVTVTECWQQADIFGDDVFLLFLCERDGREHGLVAETDRFGGVREIYLTVQHDEILAELYEHDDELLTTERVPLPKARRLLEDAIALNDRFPGEDDLLLDARAYVLARLDAMPAAAPWPEPKVYDEGVVAEFLSAEPDADEEFARAFAEFGADIDEIDPLRVSPAKFELFFDDLFGEYELDPESVDALRVTSLAFAGWQGRRDGLPEPAIEHLRRDIEEMLAEFSEDEIPADLPG
ncbi:hypothetical protein [Amycolatopsis pithecellobii]|uniref:Uncharacterized protein n=1 Tax=Amycolatopsis pithecellobii TaxID=664692 RepID=A0A6N7Z685_9PSEU|nr:hypothetical protein [Amycolatopsis pithecellobii]MTD56371.1 hypothetical protein [Amycolatopsis pithecellobii]